MYQSTHIGKSLFNELMGLLHVPHDLGGFIPCDLSRVLQLYLKHTLSSFSGFDLHDLYTFSAASVILITSLEKKMPSVLKDGTKVCKCYF